MNFVGLVGIIREFNLTDKNYAKLQLSVARPFNSDKEDDLVSVLLNKKAFCDEINCLKIGMVIGIKGRLEFDSDKNANVICERTQIF